MADLTAKFGANYKNLSRTRNVWSTDATFRDTSGNVTFTSREAEQFQRILNMAGGSLKKAGSYLRVMSQNKDTFSLSARLKIFLNSYIRGGQQIKDTKAVLGSFEQYYTKILDDKIKSVKSDAGKKKWKMQKDASMKELKRNYNSIYFVIATYITLQTAKTLVIRKLNKAKSVGTFLKTPNGFKVTAPEGFVAIDHVGNALKLVDRLEFSRANFTADKNWT